MTALVLALALTPTALAAPPKDRTSPTGPTNLQITALGPKSVSLAWSPAKNSSANWWYCVQRDGLGCFRVDPPRTAFTYPLLWPGTTYNFT